MASCESTGGELSFEWPHHRISSIDSKVTVILHNPIKHSGSERVNMDQPRSQGSLLPDQRNERKREYIPASSSGASFFARQRRARNEWLVMNRKGPWEGYRLQASPSRLPLRAHRERRLGTRQRVSPLPSLPFQRRRAKEKRMLSQATSYTFHWKMAPP